MAHQFAHLFITNAIQAASLQCVFLSEEGTTSASRIFIKVMMTDIFETKGAVKMREWIVEERKALAGLFGVIADESGKQVDLRTLRFRINYFTSIGMGVLTEELRSILEEATSTFE